MGTGAKTGDYGSGQLHGSLEPAVPPAKTERATAAAMTGSLAIFAAIRRASSLVSIFAVSAGDVVLWERLCVRSISLAKDTAEVLMALNTFARIRRPPPPLARVPHRAARGIGHKPDHRACRQSSGTWRRLRRPDLRPLWFSMPRMSSQHSHSG